MCSSRTVTSWAKSNELATTSHGMDTFPEGPICVVADSYDLWRFLNEIIDRKDLGERVQHR